MGGEGKSLSFHSSFWGPAIAQALSSSAGDAEMNKNTDFPAVCGAQVLVEKTQRVPP